MRFPVVFEGLGILSSALSSLFNNFNVSGLTLELKDRHSHDVVNTVTFNETDATEKKHSGFHFKHFKEKNLPTVDFDGVLSLRLDAKLNFKHSSKLCNSVYDQTLGKHGLVHINGLVDDKHDTILPFSKYSCPFVSLKYRILDIPSLRRHFGAKATQNSVENQRTNEFKRLLASEEEDFNDIVTLPVLDSTFNNTLKLKLFSNHIVENLNFDYLILTDDSSFLFPKNILSKLTKTSSYKLWWSDFDVFRKTGDSVEDKYTSLTYPPLPRSPSMVLSKHLVSFIAHNKDYLKQFGSLATSLGIWLSGVETKRHQDDHWNLKNCENLTISDSFLACSNMNPDTMKKLWKKTRKL